MAGSFRRAGKVGLCFVLAAALALIPFDYKIINVGDSKHSDKLGLVVEKSEAHAIAPVVGGLAALAAELGVSTEVLIAGFTAIVAGTTGYCMAQEGWENLSNSTYSDALGRLLDPNSDLGDMTDDRNFGDVWDGWNTDGRKWDDLSTDEKAKYGTPANWVSENWGSAFLAAELLETTSGGDWEPSQKPEGDKGGAWQKVRNALTVLGVGAGAVSLNEVAGALGSLVGDGLHDLLFRDNRSVDNGSFNLTYADVRYVNGIPVQMAYIPINGTHSTYCTMTPTNWNLAILGNVGFFSTAFVNGGGSSLTTANSSRSETVVMKQTSSSNNYYTYQNRSYPVSYYQKISDGLWDGGKNTSGTTDNYNITVGSIYYINSAYQMGYVFRNSSNQEVARFDGNTWTGEVTEQQPEYGQITGTPNDVTRNVLDQDALLAALESLGATDAQGNRRAIMLPDGMLDANVGIGQDAEWSTFVRNVPESQVSPLPDESPIDPNDPPVKPDDPTPPDGDWDFPKELDNAIEALGTDGFGTLFPFCLVIDIKNLVEKVNSNMTASGSSTIRVPLTDFEIPGTTDMDLNLAWLLSLGALARPWWTVLIAGVLIAESVRYFLK